MCVCSQFCIMIRLLQKRISPDVQIIGQYATAAIGGSNIRSSNASTSIRQSMPTSSSARGSITQGTPMSRTPNMALSPQTMMQQHQQHPRVSTAPYDFLPFSTVSNSNTYSTAASQQHLSLDNATSPLLLPTTAYPSQHDVASQQQQMQAVRAHIDYRNALQLNSNSSGGSVANNSLNQSQIDYRAALPTSAQQNQAAAAAAAHAQLQQMQMQSVQMAQLQGLILFDFNNR